MANTRDLLVRINGDTSGLEKALGKTEKSSGGVAAAFKKAEGSSFALLGGLTAAAAGAAVFGAQSVNAYNASVEASTKLRTNMLNVKGATDAHVQSLEKLASKLQGVGVIEDDVIKAGMSQLATFNLQGKTIETLTPKITDMVAQLKGHNATAEDMVAINNLVGKVMTGNVGALSRYGVTLSDTQKELLKNGDETQRAAVLNEVLAQNYGEVNKALRDTPQGQLTAFKNTFGDFMELIGEFVSNLVGPVITGFNNWMQSMGGPEGMLEALKQKFIQIQPYFPIIAGAILGGLVPALVAMAAAAWSAVAPLLPFLAIGALLGLGIKMLMDRFGGLQGIMARLQPALQFMGGLWRDFILPALMEVWKTFQERLLPSLQRLWGIVQPILLPVLKYLGIILGVILFGALMGFIKGLELAIGWISNIINWIGNAINWIGDLIGWFRRIPGNIANAFSSIYNTMISPFQRAFEFIQDIPGRIVGAIGNIGELLRRKLGDWDIPGPLGKVRDVIPGFAKGVRNFEGGWAMVGEQGPELVNLPRGADVFTASESRSMLRGGVSGAPVATAPAAADQSVMINFNPTLQVGMFAGMPTEYREIAERMWVEFTRIAKSNGINLQTIGARSQ